VCECVHVCVCTDASPSLLDPPEHLFRIRLVCVLLETCGQYFDRGSSRKKLDCFLVYFQVCDVMLCLLLSCGSVLSGLLFNIMMRLLAVAECECGVDCR